MIKVHCGRIMCKAVARNLVFLVSLSLFASLIVSLISVASAQAHRKPPVHEIPNFPIAKYGAVGDARTDNTKAIEAAIAAAVKAKGGNLTAGPGTYCFSGPLTLPNGVTLTGSSMSAVTFEPTKLGAAFILQGVSGISSCTLEDQPGTSYFNGFYYSGTQDPNPTQRSVYGTAGASIRLNSMNLASVECIDCNAISILNCTVNSNLNIFGSHNIVLEKDHFPDALFDQFGVYPDNKQKQCVGLSVISCTWDSPRPGQNAALISVGGGIAKGASQGIQGCNFGSNGVEVFIQNDKSVAHTNFSFANNVYAGTAQGTSLYLSNNNPNVVAYVSGNHFNAVYSPGGPPLTAAIVTPSGNASDVGSVFFSDNDVWSTVAFAGGRASVTGNKFSNWGEIQCALGSNGWVGPLTISNNSFSLSGQASPADNPVPILVELSPTDAQHTTGPVTIENNKCTSTVALPGYILVLDAANDKTTVSGNTVTPTGAVTAVVHTQAAFIALLTQFLGK